MNPFETLIPNKNTNVNNPFLSLTKEPETDKVKGGFVGEVLTGNTQRFGKTIGETIASKKNVSDFQNALKSHTDFSESLKKLIITNKKSGKDTSKLEKTLTEHLKSTPSLEAFTGDVINKSTQNILGEALGTAVEMTGVGAIKGVKGIGLVKNITKTAEEANKARQAFNALSTGQKGVSILKDTGRLLGSTLPFGYGYDVSAGLQGQRGEDRTGLNALKPGAGTLLSGVIPVGVGGLRFGRVLADKTLPYVVSNISGEPIEAYQRRQTGQLEDLMKGGSKEKTLVEARDAVTKFRVGMIEEFGNSIDDVSQQFQGTRIGFDDTNISKLKKVSDAFGFELPQNIRSLSGKETAELLTNLSESYIPNASTLNDVRMNSLVKNLRDSLKSKAVNAFGGKDGLFAKTYQNYAIKSDIYKDISSIVGKVGRRTPLQINASQNRLYNIFKENNTAYLQAVKNFEQATGTRILDRVAVDHLSNVIPKTLRSPTSNVLGWAGDVFSLITFPLSSPKVGSSIVKFISGMDEPVLSKALNKIPGARKAIYDAVYKENMSFNDAVRRYLKNPKIGMSIEDVSEKGLKGNNSLEKAKIDFEIKLRKTSPGQPESWYKFQLENQPFVKNPAKFGLKGKGVIPTNTYKGEKDLTTKILKDLEGKTTVSKQYILDATNRGELKQVERDLIRDMLKGEGDTVNVSDFAKKVKSELLPLKRNDDLNPSAMGGYKYENITLPDELRGNVENYSENIYESPIKTSAGNVHYSGDTKNYFGHTRIEDMADNKTRRVIEVQSDLYQKGNLEREMVYPKSEQTRAEVLRGLNTKDKARYEELSKKNFEVGLSQVEKNEMEILGNKSLGKLTEIRKGETSKLQQYNDPTAHFRMIREEIKKSAQDGKTKLQFPTGETAMKIEGLGDSTLWEDAENIGMRMMPDKVKVGKEIIENTPNGRGARWIITDVLGDGKFKAIPKPKTFTKGLSDYKSIPENLKETFDISGKVDTNNPISKFYEKEMQKYLNKFGGKKVVDDKGVSWIEVPIKKEWAKMPVEAFALLAGVGLTSQVDTK